MLDSLVLVSGFAFLFSVTVAPLMYAWSRTAVVPVPVVEVPEVLEIPEVPVIEFKPRCKARAVAKAAEVPSVVVAVEVGDMPTTVHGMRKLLIARGVKGAARFNKQQCLAAL